MNSVNYIEYSEINNWSKGGDVKFRYAAEIDWFFFSCVSVSFGVKGFILEHHDLHKGMRVRDGT